jgi:hypothetical protein
MAKKIFSLLAGWNDQVIFILREKSQKRGLSPTPWSAMTPVYRN